MPPKPYARADLEKLALKTARLLSKELGEEVDCKHKGQQYGSKRSPKFREEPSEWHVREGCTRSETEIVFAFRRGGADGDWELNEPQMARHV